MNSREIDGAQQIKAHINFHPFPELGAVAVRPHIRPGHRGNAQEEYARFESVGKEMAAANGYTPGQPSSRYITDSDINDWMWGTHKMLSYYLELYPTGGGPDSFYPRTRT